MTETICPDPGIYPGVSFTDYCDWNAVNHSRLQRIDKSPLHCKVLPDYEKSMAIRLGQLVHCGKLEPDCVDQRYAVMPQYELSSENVTVEGGLSKSTATVFVKEKRSDFMALAIKHQRTIVSQSEYDKYRECLDALLSNHQVTHIVNAGQSEVSIVWDDLRTGLRCKARMDSVGDVLMDLKTSRDDGDRPLPDSFEWSLWTYNYYTQAAFYQAGWKALTGDTLPFWFAVVGTNRPMCCVAAPVGEMTLQLGRDKNTERMAKYLYCVESGEWPGYDQPELFELPSRYFESDDE